MKNLFITICFIIATNFTTNAQVRYTENNKWGLKDSSGKVILKAKYDALDNNIELGWPLSRIQKNEKWGVVNSKGVVIIEPIYFFIPELGSTGYINVQKENVGWGLFDFEGKEVLPIKYGKRIDYDIKDGFFIVTDQASFLWGLLDRSLKEIIKPKYKHLEYLGFGYFKASNKSIKFKDFKCGLIDQKDNLIFDFKHDDLYVVSPKIVAIEKNEKWILVDLKENVINRIEYEGLGKLFENRAIVIRNGKYGFIDETGKEVISCQFDKAYRFENGKAEVRIENRYFDIDNTGKEIKK